MNRGVLLLVLVGCSGSAGSSVGQATPDAQSVGHAADGGDRADGPDDKDAHATPDSSDASVPDVADGYEPPQPDVCTPLTVEQACPGLECGTAPDGCGGTVSCGSCGQGLCSPMQLCGSCTKSNDSQQDAYCYNGYAPDIFAYTCTNGVQPSGCQEGTVVNGSLVWCCPQ